MRLIYDIDDVSTTRDREAAARWSVIIPAAGRGRRLNVSRPKILYPVLGKPILDWLITLLEPLCSNFVFVLSPESAASVTPHLKSALGPQAQIVLQEQPTGMANAIALCEKTVKTPYTLVLWGDQITTRARTLAACMTVLESSPALHATLPTIYRDNPYIHFVRDEKERIIQVFEARESDKKMTRGENDCGAFLFRTEALFRVLRKTRGDPAYQGAKTREQNFLSLIPLFHDAKGALATVRIHDIDETVGINTPEDAERAKQILQRRAG